MKPIFIIAAIIGNTTKRTIGAVGAAPAAETASGAPLARRAAYSSPVGMLPVVKLYPFVQLAEELRDAPHVINSVGPGFVRQI